MPAAVPFAECLAEHARYETLQRGEVFSELPADATPDIELPVEAVNCRDLGEKDLKSREPLPSGPAKAVDGLWRRVIGCGLRHHLSHGRREAVRALWAGRNRCC